MGALLSAAAAVTCLAAAPLRAGAANAPLFDCARGLTQRVGADTTRDSAHAAVIVGVVRDSAFGTVIPGVRLDIPELDAAVCSDSSGGYRLTGLTNGAVTVRATRPGYDPLSVTVMVPPQGTLRVDLTMAPRLVVLDSVHVSAPHPVAQAKPGGTATGDATWSWRGDPGASDASTGEPDLMRTLSSDPHLGLRPDWPGALEDRGGTSDQLLVRIDGLPVWSPVHGGGTLSVISPDAIGGIDLHDGAMGAAYGDRLGGVLDVSTRDVPQAGWTGSAYLGPSAMRATLAQPMTLGTASGGILLAIRHSNDELPELASDAGPMPDHWTDGIGAATLTSGRTTLKLVVVASNDRALPGGLAMPSDPLAPTAVPWSTATAGLVWSQQLGAGTRLDSHISTSRFVATVPSASDSSPSLGDGVTQTEVASQLNWHNLELGVSMDALNVSYRVSDIQTSIPTGAALASAPAPDFQLPASQPAPAMRITPLFLANAQVTTAAFVERRWGPESGDSTWFITTGVRGMSVLGMTSRLEPRIDAGLRLFPGVIATVGYARTHQVVQSLRNTESPLGAEIAVDLPVATTGSDGVPLAQSDLGTVGIVAAVGPLGRLSFDGYVRALSGLAVANPLDPGVFAVAGFVRASAHVSGLAAHLEGGAGRFTWQAGYGAGRTVESTGFIRYDPTSELGQTGSAAAGLAIDRLTEIRVAGWAAVGQRAPGLDVASITHEDDPGGPPALGGFSQHELVAPWVTTTRLPPYLRADVQLAHQWRTGPANGHLSTYLTLANVFNHANLADIVPTGPTGALHGITLVPRSLLLGIGWAY